MNFKSIRYRHNYSNITINPNGEVGGQSLTGNTIPARLKGGNEFRAEFGGFIEADNVVGLKRVKLLGITGLFESSEGIGPCYEVPFERYVIGAYLYKKLYVLIYQGEPKSFPLHKSDEPRKGGNIYPLGR